MSFSLLCTSVITMENSFIDSVILMAVLFNPFLMSAYLHELMSELTTRVFIGILIRAFLISGVVFCIFASVGESFFSQVLQVQFSAFLVFGGIIFLIIAIRFMISGARMIETLRGSPEHVAGSLAMPFMIGPGTVSASILIGNRLLLPSACLAIGVALSLSCVFLALTKAVFDFVKTHNEALVERYLEISGRIAAILIGTIAVDMIMRGLDIWVQKYGWEVLHQ